MVSCFKQFRQFPTNWLFSAQIVHSLLLREIQIDGASENELWFSVGGKKARFGQREFCLVTGLRFEKISEIINTPYMAKENGIHKRYWPDKEAEDLKLSTVYNRFVAGNFLEADDSLKMALFLIANNVLFGQPFDKKVTPWLFNFVDDLEAFNGFAWGHYVFKMTLHYLRHGFRSRNSTKGFGKVRYRLYGFLWAVEVSFQVWAMEVVDNLIDGFGMRLQDTLPRMRRWTMYKRPRNFVQTILNLEASIRSEKADVMEVLEATDDKAQVDYWVGVDYNMTEGPQFIPLVEMETKEKHELLDEGDDGNGGVVGDGDGDHGVATSQRALKRKAQKKKKKTSVKKKQRKAVPVTRLDQDEDYTPGYTPTPHAPVTVVRDPSLDREEVHTIVRDQEVVNPATEKVVGSSGLVNGDIRMGYNYAEEEDRSIRVRLRFVYCSKTKAKMINSRRKLKQQGETLEWRIPLTGLFYGIERSYEVTKLNLAWKKILETDNKAESSFDALVFQCLQDWIEYGFGNRPGWGQPWWLYTQLCVPCCVGEPDGHWILCKVDLLDHHITIFDPTGAKTKSIQVELFRWIMEVNGSPTKQFEMGKGLRQGDHLSPFKFSMVVDVMNCMLEKAKELGLVRGIVFGNDSVHLTHIQFADDTILFLEPKVSYMVEIRAGKFFGTLVLKRFEREDRSLWKLVLCAKYGFDQKSLFWKFNLVNTCSTFVKTASQFFEVGHKADDIVRTGFKENGLMAGAVYVLHGRARECGTSYWLQFYGRFGYVAMRCVDNKLAKLLVRSGGIKPYDADLCFFVDGSVHGNPRVAGISGVLRDSHGKFLCLFSLYIGVLDPILVEVFAIHRVCQLLASNHSIIHRKITIFSDSSSAASWINGEDFGNFKLVGLIQDIRQFQASPVNIAF
ncbi:hypothetical protein Ddye_000326 [Dipteronia dyeriana]|uniref:RNase H type-1 domain-containing protein n=1 Tax=Dipteronia dyeriana TaxID=168575 RepID=A0AAE0CSF5_9ROSI|nr:hypothetical protein Ddye_000326 [Dipteronia dyeriana]